MRLPESVLEDQLEAARSILERAHSTGDEAAGEPSMSREGRYERLRWFAMPEEVAHDLRAAAPDEGAQSDQAARLSAGHTPLIKWGLPGLIFAEGISFVIGWVRLLQTDEPLPRHIRVRRDLRGPVSRGPPGPVWVSSASR